MLRSSTVVAVACLVFVVCLLGSVMPIASAQELGYYEGGNIFWEARNPDNPREITVNFEFNFDLTKSSSTHARCTQYDIDNHEKLRTGGTFSVGDSAPIWMDYYCAHLDRERNTAVGYYNLTYTLPAHQDTAEITYKECCWVPGIVNNGQDITSGRGWNLASTININHNGDNAINSPPQSRAFPTYLIMSGCAYNIRIFSGDANNDKVKCRWTRPENGDCNENTMDICGKPYFDAARMKPLATIDPKRCILKFGKGDPITPGIYAMMVMLEDYAPGSKQPMSKTPVHFLMEVFEFEGQCRQPILNVPNGKCFAHVQGQEFSMRMVATATDPSYRITSIIVQGYDTESPRRVPGTDSDYEITFRFTPMVLTTYTICAMAFEGKKYASTQSCFSVKAVREGDMPEAPRVDFVATIPARGDQEATALVQDWAIKFTSGIRRGLISPAYVTISDVDGNMVWQVDATGPEVKIVNYDTLTLPGGETVFLDFETEYTISLDAGVVQSDDDCSVKSRPARWSFVTEPSKPSYVQEPDCSVSSMAMYLIKDQHDLGGYGPEIMHLRDKGCTGQNLNESHYVVFTSYGQCGTTFARNGTDFTYSNIVYIPEHPYQPPGTEITRVPHKEIRFTCNIPARVIKTLAFNPDPDILYYEEYHGRAEFLDKLPVTSLQLFENGAYNSALRDTVDVSFGSRLYFQGKASCPSNQACETFFQSCWATVSENPYDSLRHDLIKDGCIEDSHVRMHDSNALHKTRFSVDAFAFLGWRIHDTVYVHCNVFVCDFYDYSSLCKLGCNQPMDTFPRARRDVMTVVSSPGLMRYK